MPVEHLEQRQALIDACLAMNEAGINQGTSGNISVRVADDRFLITPSGIAYDQMRPEQIVLMDLDDGYFGELLPSSEWPLHLEIYRCRPEAGAIVHTHPTFCTALSCLHWTIPAFHYMIAVAGGSDIRCADYASFGSKELARNIITALEGRGACLLANHGMVCFGKTIDKALWLAIEVETLARQYWHARQAGEPVLLSEAEIENVLARFASYGKQADELPPDAVPAVEPATRRDGPTPQAAE